MSELGAFSRGAGAVRAIDRLLGNGWRVALAAQLPAKICKDGGFLVASAVRTLVADVI